MTDRMQGLKLPSLPMEQDLESKAVLKKLVKAHQALAELKGVVTIIPNQTILLSTLALQEAKDSSAIENIITTHDDLYQSDLQSQQFVTLAAKEVHKYAEALSNGYEQVRHSGLLTNNDIIKIQAAIEGNRAGFRKVPGTALKNEQTDEVIYTPPSPEKIPALMAELEHFINEDLIDWDPLTKMAVIHHQFETIHPFYDGNGRTGRVINILYLVKSGLLHSPVLYLSRYINQNKAAYYHLLQDVRVTGEWEEWLLFILEGVTQTSLQTVCLVQGIKKLMLEYKHRMRDELPKIYSQDLINNLFRHPYTKIDFVVRELRVHRNTASKYLEELVRLRLLEKHKIGKDNFFLNAALYDLLLNVNKSAQADSEP
jgi:cell filamentation protein, protein adenylyltransferase